jgi:type IV pilus assembly protein PilX
MTVENNAFSAQHGATRRSRGSVLVICLILLVITTLVGLATLRAVVIQERMAGNMQDQQSSFQGAEFALRTAENLVYNTDASVLGANMYYEMAGPDATRAPADLDNLARWALPNGRVHPVSNAGVFEGVASFAPRYLVEVHEIPCAPRAAELGKAAGCTLYRITAAGGGKSRQDGACSTGFTACPAAITVLQSSLKLPAP